MTYGPCLKSVLAPGTRVFFDVLERVQASTSRLWQKDRSLAVAARKLQGRLRAMRSAGDDKSHGLLGSVFGLGFAFTKRDVRFAAQELASI
jgi:hypothetical protein